MTSNKTEWVQGVSHTPGGQFCAAVMFGWTCHLNSRPDDNFISWNFHGASFSKSGKFLTTTMELAKEMFENKMQEMIADGSLLDRSNPPW